MSLSAGTRLGLYEVLSVLGAGGMGEVYRARDTKLNRDVALKILPDAFATDPDRLARFTREAQLLAALNHPNVAQIHGLEESRGIRALVMELVEGEDLAQRITRGAIPIDEALAIAHQIAEALEAAHEQGIIHRDLKPANVKVRPDGTVKVLDFGLAKAMDPPASSPNVSQSPTITTPAMTMAGVILGTAAYMSPEQAKGRPADRRSDLWAFGCVLYEMLTGQRAFQGEDVAETLAHILTKEPEWTLLPSDTTLPIRRLLGRCLEKNRKRRLDSASDARLDIDEALTTPRDSATSPTLRADAAPKPFWTRVVVGCIVVAVGVIGGAAGWLLRPYFRAATPGPITRFSILLPEDQTFSSGGRPLVAISPDGTRIVYSANQRLYIRALEDAEPKPMSGTDDVDGGASGPVFSPDGESVAFFSGTMLKRVAIRGGAAVTICRAENASGLSWTGDTLLFAQPGRGILQCPASSGEPGTVIAAQGNEAASSPQMLPGGEHVLFTLLNGGIANLDDAQIVVQTLKTSERKPLIQRGSDARYLPTGHIAYVSRGMVFVVPFDVNRLQVGDHHLPIIQDVRRGRGNWHLSLSQNGSLAYVPGRTLTGQLDLALIDLKGTVQPLKLPSRPYTVVRVSPDGQRLAIGTEGEESIIWTYDMTGTTPLRQLTFQGRNRYPVWSSDGAHIAFQSDREGDEAIFWQRADNTAQAERLTMAEPGTSQVPQSWSPDRNGFLFTTRTGSEVSLSWYSLNDKKATPFGDVKSNGNSLAAMFSPNGRWVAYHQGDAGRLSVFVQSFPATGTKHSVASGIQPLWAHDGRRLFYGAGMGLFAAVDVAATTSFSFGKATALPRPFLPSEPQLERPFDLMPDDQHIVGIVAPGSTQPGAGLLGEFREIRVVLNWLADVSARTPTK